jgi:hypothetical protein
MKAILWAIGLALTGFGPVLAVDKSFSKVLKYAEIKGTGARGETLEYLVPALIFVAAVLLVIYLYRRLEERRRQAPSRTEQKQEGIGFREQAAQLGFRLSETKTLRRLAARLAPQRPDRLLSTEIGRWKLAADIERRIRQREREIEVLRRIRQKLEHAGAGQLHERATVRVEADLPVWITLKMQGQTAEEDVFAEVEQIRGHLLDLSEGGAALRTPLEAQAGDVVEFWSAEARVWLPPVTAGVLSVEEEGYEKIFHLHFLEPPTNELRMAIQELQIERVHQVDAP